MTRVNGPNGTGSIDNNGGGNDKPAKAASTTSGKITAKPASGKVPTHSVGNQAAQGVRTNFDVNRKLTSGELAPNTQEGLTMIGSQNAGNLPDDFLNEHLADLEKKNPTKAYELLEARYNKPLLNELGV